MKFAMLFAVLSLLAAPAFAMKSCDELKSEIEARIQSHGVKNFSLEVVAKGEAKDAKVVGSCEGGSKEIAYKKL